MKSTVLPVISLLAAFCSVASGQQPLADLVRSSGVRGGLIVQLGCSDAAQTASLRVNDSYLVHGLDANASLVDRARTYLHQRGLYGPIAVDTFNGRHLPYVDNLVNLLVADQLGEVPLSELLRVLCPNGVAYVKQDGTWQEHTKPWPADIDQWTHFHHDPQGTMVGGDTAMGPPRKIQWLGGPKWLRNHDFMSSMHAMVSAEGRIFYVIDEGLRNHIFLPARWTLIARDGFNGKILWKQPLDDWYPNNWPLKSGPGHNPRKLVAVGDCVYVAAGLTQPVRAHDAATGKILRTYEGTRPTREILLSDGTLYLVVDPDRPPVDYRAETSTYKEIQRANSQWAWSADGPQQKIAAVDAQSGRLLWEQATYVAPLTLTISQDKVFYHDGAQLVALDRNSGDTRWDSETRAVRQVPTGGSLRVVYSDGVVLFANGTNLSAFSAESGQALWDGALMKTSHHCPEDLFVIDGVVWSANTGRPQQDGTHFKVMDLHTGEIEKDFVASNLPGFPMHPRCYPSRATTKYIMTNGMGTEFYEVGGSTVDINNAVRGSCIYGIMPSNGLLYKPPDSCACYYQSKLEWLCALAPESSSGERPMPEDRRLETGPAYAQRVERGPAVASADKADWPMYRRDTTRSGSSSVEVPADLSKCWSVKLGGRITQPVVVGRQVFVAAVDTHTLYAMNTDNGEILWHFTAGGRIDSSPTIYNETVLFGSADGWVYCLRAKDGKLAWRYLVALGDKRIASYQQIESAWPVSGSLLVHDGEVYCLAGRNMFFDGGLRLVRLEPATGALISETLMDETDPATGENLQTLITQKVMPVANADLLSCDGKYVYMQAQKFTLEGQRLEIAPQERTTSGGRHLFCQTGFSDDVWFHRSYWIYGEDCGEGWGDYAKTRDTTPCGRIMVLDDQRAYAFRDEPLGNMLHPRTRYQLYAADKNPTGDVSQPPDDAARKKARRTAKKQATVSGEEIIGGCKVHWKVELLPLLANAMTLAGKNLFLAGPADLADETGMLGYLPGADDAINRELRDQEQAWLGQRGGVLWVVSAANGDKLASYPLESFPVFDGMSAARGGLYMALINGTVVKYGSSDQTADER